MPVSLAQLQAWMDASSEDEHLEFKEAKQNFHFEKLVKYCAAIANEGGGTMILGVTDRPPRQVVGSQAFEQIERTKAGLIDRLRLRVDVDEVPHPDGRVVVFQVPARPIGMPIAIEGAYWMRGGEDLVAMTPDQLKRIFDESGPDFSAEICPGASLDDLAPAAIEVFRQRWIKQAKNEALAHLAAEQLLMDAELIDHRGITYAALVLLGSRRALGRFLAQSEVVFEYRSTEAAGPANQRLDLREGFLLYYDKLWETVNLRNDLQHFQDGLFMLDVPTFHEGSVREAILNAVAHRDYRMAGSVFVRQYPRRIEIVSPGGLPAGITPENILYRQSPRNRRIAEAFEKCDLVERSGQGANRMFEDAIRYSKPFPDFRNTDAHQVSVTLHGQIQDPTFLRFLEEFDRDQLSRLTTGEWQVLDLLHRNQAIAPLMRQHVMDLTRRGMLDHVPEKWGRQCIRELVSGRIELTAMAGMRRQELSLFFPSLSRDQMQKLLGELQAEGRIWHSGTTRGARWYAASIAPDAAEKGAGK